MRKITSSIVFFILLYACQDVIEVEVPIDEPRLVIDALIRIDDIAQPTAFVQIKASITSSFFSETQPTALTSIVLTNTQSGDNETLTSSQEFGLYTKEVPMQLLTEGDLELSILYNGQNYLAKTKFVPSVPIDNLEQGNGTLFTGTETEVILTFRDAPDRTDFYLFDFDFSQYLVSEDTFYPGQSFQFSYFYDQDLLPGREVTISILGVDEPFYNYMNQLILQSGGDQGPFQTPAATVKGNIINTSDSTNFALGYFAVCQSFTDSLMIEERN